MGKRQRRRNRERAKSQKTLQKPPFRDSPNGKDVQLRAVVAVGTSAELEELCFQYWERTPSGGWAHRVADLGGQRAVKPVREASVALLMQCLCTVCGEAPEATSRAAAQAIGGPLLDRAGIPYRCRECRTAVAERERQEALEERQRQRERARQERARKKEEELRVARAIAELRARQNARQGSSALFSAPLPIAATVVYTAMAAQAAAFPSRPLPSVHDLTDVGWTGDFERDHAAVMALYQAQMLAIHDATDERSFAVNAEGGVTFAPCCVRWRLTDGVTGAATAAAELREQLVVGMDEENASQRKGLEELVTELDVADVVQYFDGLLEVKYEYPKVPESRRVELANHVRFGLDHGYTPGQMQCFAWRAADTAAGWKERTKNGEGAASSAAVTIFGRKIEDAKAGRWPVPEYAPPHWHQSPPALAAARSLWAEVQRVRDPLIIQQCGTCDSQGLVEPAHDYGVALVEHCRHVPQSAQEAHQTQGVGLSPAKPEPNGDRRTSP